MKHHPKMKQEEKEQSEYSVMWKQKQPRRKPKFDAAADMENCCAYHIGT